jgi:hypothetical protein
MRLIISRSSKISELLSINENGVVIRREDGTESKISIVTLTTGYKLVREEENISITKEILEKLIEEDKRVMDSKESKLLSAEDVAKIIGVTAKVLRKKLRKMNLEKTQREWKFDQNAPDFELFVNTLRGNRK